jgi:hypothetical protein
MVSGYPDSHLSAPRWAPASRMARLVLAAIPLVLAALWLCYYWSIMAVFPATEKYPGGRIKSQGYVRRAGVEEYKRHGHWVTYHENGQKASEGDYQCGMKSAQWRYWDENGREVAAAESEVAIPASAGVAPVTTDH